MSHAAVAAAAAATAAHAATCAPGNASAANAAAAAAACSHLAARHMGDGAPQMMRYGSGGGARNGSASPGAEQGKGGGNGRAVLPGSTMMMQDDALQRLQPLDGFASGGFSPAAVNKMQGARWPRAGSPANAGGGKASAAVAHGRGGGRGNMLPNAGLPMQGRGGGAPTGLPGFGQKPIQMPQLPPQQHR